MSQGQTEVQDIMAHLLQVYQSDDLGAIGVDPTPAPITELFDSFETPAEQAAAAKAVQHFLDSSRKYLLDHPAQQQVMLAEGFGLVLGGGITVSLTPPVYDNPGMIEEAGDVPISMPVSIRGQHGIEEGHAIGVTGSGPDMTVRRPGT
jgi:hypothetical protein